MLSEVNSFHIKKNFSTKYLMCCIRRPILEGFITEVMYIYIYKKICFCRIFAYVLSDTSAIWWIESRNKLNKNKFKEQTQGKCKRIIKQCFLDSSLFFYAVRSWFFYKRHFFSRIFERHCIDWHVLEYFILKTVDI